MLQSWLKMECALAALEAECATWRDWDRATVRAAFAKRQLLPEAEAPAPLPRSAAALLCAPLLGRRAAAAAALAAAALAGRAAFAALAAAEARRFWTEAARAVRWIADADLPVNAAPAGGVAEAGAGGAAALNCRDARLEVQENTSAITFAP